MITAKDVYNVLSAVVPLYVTMFLAYGSVRWWKVFTAEQCAGINRFVAIFAVPLLSFEFISRIDPFKLNFLFIAADSLSKVVVLIALFAWSMFSKNGSLDWCITLFSLSTLPNTLVMGIPLLKSMYGDNQEGLMIQVVVLQSIIWYTLLLFLFEYRAARDVVVEKLKERNSTSESFEDPNVGRDEVHVIIARPSLELELQRAQNFNKVAPASEQMRPQEEEDGKELHMFVWRCNCCSSGGLCEHSLQGCSTEEERKEEGKAQGLEGGEEEKKIVEGATMSSGMVRLIMKMVCTKLIRNPNTYASLLGVSWALASSRWNIKKPPIMDNSVTILSNAGLGMAMFSLGLFMALQPRIIACGGRVATYGMLIRFIAGPAVMAIASIVVGIRGTILKVSIVQAALPQGIVPFVFAREYNLHPEVLSTALIFGMIVALPITILYYVFLGF